MRTRGAGDRSELPTVTPPFSPPCHLIGRQDRLPSTARRLTSLHGARKRVRMQCMHCMRSCQGGEDHGSNHIYTDLDLNLSGRGAARRAGARVQPRRRIRLARASGTGCSDPVTPAHDGLCRVVPGATLELRTEQGLVRPRQESRHLLDSGSVRQALGQDRHYRPWQCRRHRTRTGGG